MKLYKITGATALALGLLAATPAMAGDYADDAGAKFTRGIANSATGWGEIPKNINNETRDSNILVGLTYGTLNGAVHTVGRTAVGAFDLATFFIPSNEIVHSTYVWKQTRDDTTYGVF